MKLHKIVHNNASQLWCGPAAMAAITGRATKEIHQCIRDVTGKTKVAGLNNFHLVKSMRALGFSITQRWISGRVTLARWAKQNKHVFSNRPIIVNLTHHYVTLMGIRFVDNHTHDPVLISKAPFRRKRVQSYFEITPLGAPTWVPSRPLVRTPEENKRARYRGELLKLAGVHNISIEDHIFPREWFVYPPPSLESESLDPCYNDHFACGAEERASRIETYLKSLNVPLPIV